MHQNIFMASKFLTENLLFSSWQYHLNLWIKLLEPEQKPELWTRDKNNREDSLLKAQLLEIISYLYSANLCFFRKSKAFAGLI